MIEAFAGVTLALLAIVVARRKNYENWMYSISLISLPVIYMVFGIFSEGNGVVLREFLYGIPFLAVGFVVLRYGFRSSAYIVGFLWLIHGGYDLFHDDLFINTGVFSWYPILCASVDLLIGIYLLTIASTLPNADIKLAAK